MPSARSNERPTPPAAWPLFRTLRGLTAADLNRDLAAGLTLAAIAIPEQMATARLGGFPPQIGFFAFMAGTLAFAAFGSSRLLSIGADSTITPIFAGSLALLAASGSPEYAISSSHRRRPFWACPTSAAPFMSAWRRSRAISVKPIRSR
jgi:MFS superfamily sulfate permease-like transporter